MHRKNHAGYFGFPKHRGKACRGPHDSLAGALESGATARLSHAPAGGGVAAFCIAETRSLQGTHGVVPPHHRRMSSSWRERSLCCAASRISCGTPGGGQARYLCLDSPGFEDPAPRFGITIPSSS
jgi:hypothetical protein